MDECRGNRPLITDSTETLQPGCRSNWKDHISTRPSTTAQNKKSTLCVHSMTCTPEEFLASVEMFGPRAKSLAEPSQLRLPARVKAVILTIMKQKPPRSVVRSRYSIETDDHKATALALPVVLPKVQNRFRETVRASKSTHPSRGGQTESRLHRKRFWFDNKSPAQYIHEIEIHCT